MDSDMMGKMKEMYVKMGEVMDMMKECMGEEKGEAKEPMDKMGKVKEAVKKLKENKMESM